MSALARGSSPNTASKPWIGLGLLMIPVFMMALDMTVLFLAIPTIAAELLPSGTQQLWVLHIGDIAGASLVLTAGRLVDRFGPRRLLIGGTVLYGVASIFAAFSPTVETLIIARMLLGASAVTVAPAGMALIRKMFTDTRSFSIAVSLFMAAFSGGMAMGPPIGGLLLENFWWGSIFIVNAPIALIVAVLAPKLLPDNSGSGEGRIDTNSILLSAAGLGATVYGAQELAASGWNLWYLAITMLGILLLTGFVVRQRVSRYPLLDLQLFRSLPLTLGLASIWLMITATAGADLQFAQHLQVVQGFSPVVAGLLLTIPALGSMIATAAAPLLLRVIPPGPAMGTGVVIAVLGSMGMVLLLASDGAGSTLMLILLVSIIAVGVAPVFAIATNIILTNASADHIGSAQATQEVSGSLGNTTGLALGGSIAYLGYSRHMRANAPEGLSESEIAQGSENIGGAISLSQTLSPESSTGLMSVAEQAFVLATRDAYILAVAGLALVAMISFWGLRNAKVDIEEERDDSVPPVKLDDGQTTLAADSLVPTESDVQPSPLVRAFGTSLNPDEAIRFGDREIFIDPAVLVEEGRPLSSYTAMFGAGEKADLPAAYDEVWVVIKGRLLVASNGSEIVVDAGTMIHVPQDSPGVVEALEDTTLVSVSSPPH